MQLHILRVSHKNNSILSHLKFSVNLNFHTHTKKTILKGVFNPVLYSEGGGSMLGEITIKKKKGSI